MKMKKKTKKHWFYFIFVLQNAFTFSYILVLINKVTLSLKMIRVELTKHVLNVKSKQIVTLQNRFKNHMIINPFNV